MANYLPVVLSPTVKDWLTGLPTNSINSWRDLCARFIDNMQGTFTKPGVEWDLYQIHQKKGESLREFIRRFMKKKNTIPGISDIVIMVAFRRGVKDPDLLNKLSRRQPETVKELFDMANRYTNQEEAMTTKNDDHPCQKQNLTAREINAITPVTPKYLKWSEAPITFDRSDHPDNIPHPGRYPLVLDPIIRTIKLNRVLIDGGSGLNILFAKTLDDMKIPRSKLKRSRAPFHGVIPGTSATPLGTIKLPVTFGSRENFWTEDITFEVTDFEAAYHAILGRPALTKFMAVSHYTYMLMKLPGPNGVISLQGDVRRSYDCDMERCTLAENIRAKADRDSIQLATATLQDEGEVPAKKATKARINADQDVKKIALNPSNPAKMDLIGTGLNDK